MSEVNNVKDVSVKRQDPTSFLPEEAMSYELKPKKKKKKKKHNQEDPFKDLGDVSNLPTEITLDPEVNIKVENIEVELDFNDFTNDNGLMVEGIQSEDSQEPVVKLEQQNREAVILTFESVVSDKSVFNYNQPSDTNIVGPKHICKVCHLVFQSIRTLKMHQKRKHKVFRRLFEHVCENCGMSYDQKSSLIAHIRRKHGPDSLPDDREERTCDICALVFKGMTRLRMHMRRKHGSFQDSFQYACKDCGLTYDKYRSLIVHIRRKHNEDNQPVPEQWYNCPFCPKAFTKRETYARHVQRKHQEDEDMDNNDRILLKNSTNEQTGEVSCKECPLVFSSLNYLKLHMRRKHNALKDNFRLKCKFCNLSYDKIESLKRHIRRKHDKGSYCEVCNKQFDTRELYLNHTHIKMIRECSICGLIFASKAGLGKHLRCTHKIDSPKIIFCHICNEGFHDKRQLKPHLMKVHLKVSYTCIHCSKIFKCKESYRRHILFKHPVKNINHNQLQKCENCPETFTDELELSKHVNIFHGQESNMNEIVVKKEEVDIKESFQCSKCSESFLTWELLRLHFTQNHHVVKDTQCQVCGQIVKDNELQKHIKSNHTEVTILECKYCEFKTKSRGSLTQHLLRHKNATTLNCEMEGCRYKTFYEVAMMKHKQKHNEQGVKLQCSKCSFQTMNKYILKYHEDAHLTGKKKYACDKCDYATILPANLVQHKYKHSTEKKFKCEVCPFATKYNTSLRFHVKKKHCDLPSFS
ncbi:PREDICTED: zinc finger protein 845-like [Papilio xuthus]|uniref:Zinc finger protein 845-like n=1 Tax=Papilio xuthus TaxID=66420 RepID=A0AAJ6ZT94_PAPXU|nr:PREDICTED: zinc finger protein 845-like [Papilio xuthus]